MRAGGHLGIEASALEGVAHHRDRRGFACQRPALSDAGLRLGSAARGLDWRRPRCGDHGAILRVVGQTPGKIDLGRLLRRVRDLPRRHPAPPAQGSGALRSLSRRTASQPCRRRSEAPDMASSFRPSQGRVQADPLALAEESLESQTRRGAPSVGALPPDQSADRAGLLP